MSFRGAEMVALVALLVACEGPAEPAGPPETEPEPTVQTTTPPGGRPTTTTTPTACEGAELEAFSEPAAVSRLTSAIIRVTGSVGVPEFALIEDPSGGILDETTGAYLAGPTEGVVDVVQVIDSLCGSTVEVDIPVLGDFRVLPSGGTIPPNSAFTVETEGGSGQHSCQLVGTESGATMNGCDYQAGAFDGVDEVRVVDAVSGQEQQVTWTVQDGVAVTLYGARLAIPLGHTFQPTWQGGTSEMEYALYGSSVTAVDGLLVGDAPGRTDVVATDRFTGLQTSFVVDVIAPVVPPVPRDGDRQDNGQVLGPGDLDGDGYPDVLVSKMDLSDSAWQSGSIQLFRGGPYGPEPLPVQTLSWPQEQGWSGRDMAIGDVNGDGLVDLLFGAEDVDEAGSDSGAVALHLGLAGGVFEDAPTLVSHAHTNAQLGRAVRLCDIDGDGLDDVIATAPFLDDTPPVDVRDAGGLYLWWGSGALWEEPDAVVWAWVPDAKGGWTMVDDSEMGKALEVGDFDGDGLCDVAASNQSLSLDGEGTDGVVWLYLGADLVGVEPKPARIFTHRDADGRVDLGTGLAVADFDSDGRDDLAIGGPRWDDTSSSMGAAWVFLSTDDDGRDPPMPVYADEASWWAMGDNGSDELGFNLATGDWDLDGVPELLAFGLADETDYSVSGSGAVWAFSGTDIGAGGGVQRTRNDALAGWGGDDGTQRFGRAMAVVDADADGLSDLVVLAPRDDNDGTDVGSGYWVSGADGTVVRVPLAGSAGMSELGEPNSMHRYDIDGDGVLDLVLGTAEASPAEQFDAGALWWHSGAVTDWGVGQEGPVSSRNGSFDRYGQAVDRGDFDGDGYEDLVVVAWSEDGSSSLPAEFEDPDGCYNSNSNTGAAWVFRGTAAGVESTAAFVMFGLTTNDELDTAVMGADFDGDGRDDLFVGSDSTNGVGSVSMALGRDSTSGLTRVLCAEWTYEGVASSGDLGRSLAALGDIDGDGCDEVAVGVPEDDFGENDQGGVRVLWGTGGPGCGQPEVTTLVSNDSFTRLGDSVAGGGDVDGDGVPDLAAGAYSLDVPSGEIGAVYWMSGVTLEALPRDSVSGGLPAESVTTWHDWTALGTSRVGFRGGDELGRGVAFVDDPLQPGHSLVAAGTKFGSIGGVERAGGVVLYGWDGVGLSADPVWLIGGETAQPGGWFGRALRGDGPWLLIGASRSDAVDVDMGAVYPFELVP